MIPQRAAEEGSSEIREPAPEPTRLPFPVRYYCRVCRKVFAAEQNRVRHQYKAHAIISYCRECKDYLVPGNNGGKVHAVEHTDNPMRCNCCLSIWKSPMDRNTHVWARKNGYQQTVQPMVWTKFEKEYLKDSDADGAEPSGSKFVPTPLSPDEEEDEDTSYVSPATSPSLLAFLPPKIPKVYSCKLCTKQYGNGNSLKYHTFSIHAVRSYCTICSVNVSVGRDGGMKHAKEHFKKPLACRCCRAVWKNAKDLRVHIKDRDAANVIPAVWTEFTSSKVKGSREVSSEGAADELSDVSPSPMSPTPPLTGQEFPPASSLQDSFMEPSVSLQDAPMEVQVDQKPETVVVPVTCPPPPPPILVAQPFSVIQQAPPAVPPPAAPIDPTLLLLLLNALSSGATLFPMDPPAH